MTIAFATHRARMPDMWIAVLAAVLATAGIVISSSARTYEVAVSGGSMLRPMAHFVLALIAMALTLIPDYRRLASPRGAWAMLVVVTGLLVAALFGPEIANTHRWIRIAGFSMQPSELGKLVLIVVVSAALVRSGENVRTWGGLGRPLLLGGWIAGLVFAGKDLGTPALMGACTLVLCFVAGARMTHLAGLLGAFGGLATCAIAFTAYRRQRVAQFLDVWFSAAPDKMNGDNLHQLKQSVLAIGSGGPFGKGFGMSTQKYLFLPEPDNDFIFAVLGEELGLIGALLVLVAFLVIAWRGFRIARTAEDELGRLIAIGATTMLCGQALCHMGVVTGLLPTKGLCLPFISSGGWSLIVTCALAGLLMNVSLRRRLHVR